MAANSITPPALRPPAGSPYDYLGVLRFAVPFLRGSKDRWFCSELVAAALRDLAGWSIDPAKARPSTVYFHLGGKR